MERLQAIASLAYLPDELPQASLRKHKEKTKAKLSKYKARITDAEETIRRLKKAAQTRNAAHSLRDELEAEMRRLPAYQGSRAEKDNMDSITFIDKKDCCSMGWEREFQERFDKARKSVKSASKFLYLPGRTFFVDDSQHALAIGPLAQKSEAHNFELASTLDGMVDEERELFFDLGKDSIFYAGTYRYVRLDHLYPDGVPYSNNIHGEFGLTIRTLSQTVVESQIQRPSLRHEEIAELIKSDTIKLEFIGLQCVGFNYELYYSITDATCASTSHEAGGVKRNYADASADSSTRTSDNKRRRRE
ncbi:hypothetical protein WG66_012439 [Moniliophthora roreri]|uniref:Uncharacterized protein n=1 Tax=Moniliophthora roreri TaxID=221103 RepID=A0A0W0FL76_MONRR|nr:hypothetical protein WG66_012439 [Moniliophthora roreri]